ncbi:MAG: YraN family protein [Gemmatimonadaceae bacterium]|nr:YraN family protein [Chitinophagaceae bacterium]
MEDHNRGLGKTGEALAAEYLNRQGFTVLHKNWRKGRLEVDIIAARDDVLHVIEVKTRRNNVFGEPEDSIGLKKIERMLRGGLAYVSAHPHWARMQLDVLSITMMEEEPAYFLIEDVYL